MLEPRQSDIPALFLVLVVLPVAVYILLGKWSETSKRKERISLLVDEAAAESFRGDSMAAATAIPLVPPPPSVSFRECARCRGPATTRCSRCKSVRYCSGKCQIIHWRQGHKEECQPPDSIDSSFKSSTIETSVGRKFLHDGPNPQFVGCPSQQSVQEGDQCDVQSPLSNPITPSVSSSFAAASVTVDGFHISKPERRISEKRVSRKSTKGILNNQARVATSSTDGNMRSTVNPSKEAYIRHKLRGDGFINLEDDFPEMHGINGSVTPDEYTDQRGALQPNIGIKSENRDSLCSTKRGMYAHEIGPECNALHMNCEGSNHSEEVLKRNSFPEMVSRNGSIGSKKATNVDSVKVAKSPKSMSRAAREDSYLAKVRKGHGINESAAGMGNFTSVHGSNGTSVELMKFMGVKKSSKITRKDASELGVGSRKKVKVLFCYEEFTKFFEDEVFDLAPRGLLNCGNSCYANAVLQCLTCTKPLVTYLLSRTHSRACCLKNWCLMCELEQHVMMLKEAGGPLSPSRILSHIRSMNCQIGDGSQEDAHEFLRLLVASMQSICLEEVGGENQVHPSLQETTFVQQTFGGHLRSLVKCLKCHHESERYENIMDLTLEIFGWVESLEDALTQFTTPEDLDGENMYRCGRCACYVRARKQLSIDEAPNILTIVLKRFQEGNYGKINKCITFPEMLDMIPFMTGTNDAPPLYILYGVVVHVDTLNASFSGHYVSYVKDLRGNWFRIDDTSVQPVPMSQVMSEGAYILFYMRSSPRPPRSYIRKATRQQAVNASRHFVSESPKSSEIGQSINGAADSRIFPDMETYSKPRRGIEFSDTTSSDWSLFTSSDEASFTSESTRDSFSTTTTDYSDIDPFSPMFNTSYRSTRELPCPSQRMISCRMFSGSKPVTRYMSEQKGYIFDSHHSLNPPPLDEEVQVSVPFNETFPSDSGYQNFVNYESSSTASDAFLRTFSNCQL